MKKVVIPIYRKTIPLNLKEVPEHNAENEDSVPSMSIEGQPSYKNLPIVTKA